MIKVTFEIVASLVKKPTIRTYATKRAVYLSVSHLYQY